MSALPADIAPAMREAVIVSTSDASLLTRFPNARDGEKDPAPGYFDDPADAATALAARRTLIGVVRRRFTATIADMIVPSLAAGVPTWTLVDPELNVDAPHLVSRIEVNFETEQTGMELLG